jgi:hypothetical protein
MLTDFLSRHFVAVDGRSVSFDGFMKQFHDFLFANGVNPTDWQPERVRSALEQESFVIGHGSNAKIIGNLEARNRPRRWVRRANQPNKLQLASTSK